MNLEPLTVNCLGKNKKQTNKHTSKHTNNAIQSKPNPIRTINKSSKSIKRASGQTSTLGSFQGTLKRSPTAQGHVLAGPFGSWSSLDKGRRGKGGPHFISFRRAMVGHPLLPNWQGNRGKRSSFAIPFSGPSVVAHPSPCVE